MLGSWVATQAARGVTALPSRAQKKDPVRARALVAVVLRLHSDGSY